MSEKKTYTDVKSFVVDRKKWYRGHGSSRSFLRVKSGKHKGQMCCLGQYGLACGLTTKQITAIRDPQGMIGRLSENERWKTKLLNRGYDTNSDACTLLMDTNDDIIIDDVQRETALTKLFSNIGVKVKFKG